MDSRHEYRAKPGVEDRHGEMTGAITVNLIIACTLSVIWCVFIAPWLGMSAAGNVASGLVLGVFLTLAGIPVSRHIWGYVSGWMDGK